MRSKVTPRWLKLSEGSRKAVGCLLPNASSTPSIRPARRATTAIWAPAAGMPLVVWDWVSKNIAPPSAPKNHLNRFSRTWATGERSECADWASSEWAAATAARATNGRARERMRMGLPPNEESKRCLGHLCLGIRGRRPPGPSRARQGPCCHPRPTPARSPVPCWVPWGCVTYSNKTAYSVNVARLGRGLSPRPGAPRAPWPSETHPFGKRREGPGSNQAELFSHPREGRQGLIEVVPLVRGGDLAADPRRALRHHRVAEAGDEDALLEEQLAHPDRGRRLADDHRDDRGLSGERLEAELEEAIAKIAGVLAQPGHPLRVSQEELHRGEGAPRDGAGKRVAEELRPGARGEVAADALRAVDEPSRRAAQRLAERAGDDVHLAQHAMVLGGAAPGPAQDAGGMAVVHHEHGAVTPAHLEESGKIGDGALHREDPVGDHPLHFAVLRRGETGIDVGEVLVLEDAGLALDDCLGKADAVDDGGVVELIAQHEVALGERRRGERLVGVPAAHEAERGDRKS